MKLGTIDLGFENVTMHFGMSVEVSDSCSRVNALYFRVLIAQ